MSTFLFSVIPALGHINPTMPVAAELKKRGHTVGYATGEDFRRGIEAEGIRFFPVGMPGLQSEVTETARKMLKHTGMLSHYYFFKMLSENNRQSIEGLRAAINEFKPEVIVADSLTHAGPQMAEIYGLPWASFSSVPGLIPSRDAPPFTTWGLPPTENPLVQGAYGAIRIGQHVFFRLFDPRFNRIRKSLGLPPLKGCALSGGLSPYLIMIPSCEGFEYRRSDWPRQTHLIGPAPWGKAPAGSDAFQWIDELPQDRPVIYATIGTVQGFRSLKFFNMIIDGLKDEPCYVVLSVGQGADLSQFSRAPDHFRFERFVPHAKMLPRTTAVIHHGGQGIAQDSVYHGLPSVVIPISQDLYEVARRCASAGVSVRIPYPRLTPERLRCAVRRILDDPEIRERTRRLQARFLETHAGETGAALLEKLADSGAPIYRC